MIRPPFDAPDLFSVSSAVILYKCVYTVYIYVSLVGYRCFFFFFLLPRLWIDDGRSIFDYEIEINKCASLSSVSSFLRV